MGVQASFWDSDFISSDISPEMGLLDHMVVLFLTFWGSSKLFSIVAEPLFISTNSGYLFSTSSSILLITVSLMMTTVTDRKWYLVVLISISLTVSHVEHLFMDLLVICTSLGEGLFISSANLLIRLFVFSLLSYMDSIYYGYQPLIRYTICKYLLQIIL